jgi:hypothetical protein
MVETMEIDKEQAARTEVMPLYSGLSEYEQLKALYMTITIFERRQNLLFETSNIVGALRGVQRQIM